MSTEQQEPSVTMSAETLQMYDRRVVGRTERGVAYDTFGREHFRKMGMPLVLRAVPSIAEHFTLVPGEFWTLDVNSEGYSAAQVTCPCGHVHEIDVGHVMETDCERFFYALGDALLVANSPTPES